jgi:hypothetical protein
MHRLLKPGAAFATAVWSTPEKVPMIGLARDAISRATGITPPPGGPDPVKLADTSILERALAAAGFSGVAIERMTVTFEFPNADAFADFRSEIGGTRAMLMNHPPEVRRKARDSIVAAARPHLASDGALRLRNETICFSSRA